MRTTAFSTLLACFWLFAAACNEPFDFSTVLQTGRLVVEVADTSSTPVPNVLVELLLADNKSVWRTSRTGADGRAEVGAEDGGVLTENYFVRVTPPSGYRVPPMDVHPVPVRIITDSTLVVPVTLVKLSSGVGTAK